MPAPTVPCPTCSLPTLDGVCRRCALNTALRGLTAGADEQDAHPVSAPDGYELLYELGTGATAVVWLARERRLDRLVALKFIATTADRRLTRRLIREGQATARLHHPHLVAVHALGETPEHAYLAMDFCEGGDLRQQLARQPLAPRPAADLVRKLAGALAHAHGSGVLHRDIKPSNVLLDAAGEPRLGDFGLAAPLEGGGDLTQPGQVAGTAAYLAPELLAGAQHATAQSDVYGLGAVLYECLTGRAPFLGDSSAAIFAQLGHLDPPAPRLLCPTIPRDLETICLKCLEKSPARRYASAEALADDLARFLRGDAIAARPVTQWGKVVRWCRRNPATAGCAAAAASLLLALAMGGPIVALRLARANARAATEAASAKAVVDFLQQDLLAQASPSHQRERDVMLRTVVDRAAERIDGRFAQQPLVEADIRETLATTQNALGDYAAARRQWEKARLLRTAQLGPDDPKTLRASAGLFNAWRAVGQFRTAEALARDVVVREDRVLGPEHPDTLWAQERLGAILRQQGRLAEAEEHYRALLPIARRQLGAEHSTTLAAMNNLALVCQERGKFADAEPLHRARLDISRRTLGSDHPSTLTSMYNLALMCSEAGRVAEAETLCAQVSAIRTRVLGAEHPDTLHALRVLAWLDQDLGKFAEAEALDRRVLDAQIRKLGRDHPDTLVTKSNLGRLYRELGRSAEAEKLMTDALAARQRALGPENSATLQTMSLLAGIYLDTGRVAEARRLGAQAYAGCVRTLNATNPVRVTVTGEFGRILVASGEFAAAEPPLREALAHLPLSSPKGWRAAVLQSQLGQALLALRRPDEATQALTASLAILQRDAAFIPPSERASTATAAACLTQVNESRQLGPTRHELATVAETQVKP